MHEFSESTLIPEAHGVLKDVFGYDSFRPGQAEVVETLLDGGHILAVMPTGSGKSLCFQIPALLKGGLTLVVSPLVALMEDQVAALRLAGVAAETINSSRDHGTNVDAWRRVAGGETRILYLSPERLMTERMLAALGRLPLSLIAVDEAHCISRWGPSFRPEYEDLSRLGTLFEGVPIAALTATADHATRDDIVTKLFAGRGRALVTGFDRPNIRLAVAMRQDWKSQLLEFVQAHAGECGIVYCLKRRQTEEIATWLDLNGVTALPYHAGMEKDDRSANQERFMAEPGVVIVATIAFGMGIDKADVRYVFHTNLPGSVEAYYQEIGRAGRDGLAADTLMLYGLDDIRLRRMFIDQEDSDDDHRRREHKRLDALIAYCETPECRRQVLLAYFDDEPATCGNCDVLRGTDTEKIRRFGHDRLEAHGMGVERPKDEWRSIIRQMVAAGYLMLDIQGHGGLSIGERGRALRDGDEVFNYRRDAVERKPARKAKKTAPAALELSDGDAALFDVLKTLRRELAQARGVPAYAVFPDRALAHMARRKPATEDDFADIHGVGAAKLRDFAEPFLGTIAGHLAGE
jgi:ATP-dependent DNA helicase RecQ